MLILQRELDNAREDAQRAREREAQRARRDEEELQILRARCERLERERTSAVCSVTSPYRLHLLTRLQASSGEQLRGLRPNIESFISDSSHQNNAFRMSKDSDLVVRDLDVQLKDHKHNYEQATGKTERFSVECIYAHPSLHFFASFSYSHPQLL